MRDGGEEEEEDEEEEADLGGVARQALRRSAARSLGRHMRTDVQVTKVLKLFTRSYSSSLRWRGWGVRPLLGATVLL